MGGHYLVAVDLEGVACAVPQLGGSVEDSFNIAFVREQASREADAAARALFDAGAERVTVWDNHGRGCSLDYRLLDRRVELAIGATVYERLPLAPDEALDGVVLVGYHAMEGTPDAVMAHTFSSVAYQGLWIDDVAWGEIAMDAASAGRRGAPVICVSSCDAGCREAARFLPWAETVATKRSLAFTRIVSLHPDEAVARVYAGVTRAMARRDEMRPFTVSTPVMCKVRYKRMDAAQHAQLVDRHGRGFAFEDAFTRYGELEQPEDFILRKPAAPAG